MSSVHRDYWWLIALEATLFLSISHWETTAPYAEPATYPIHFTLIVVASATLGMLAAHIGLAFFASRVARVPTWCHALVVTWLAVGYLDALMNHVVALYSSRLTSPLRWPLLGGLLVAGLVRHWWKSAVPIGLLLGASILGIVIFENGRGLFFVNPHYSSSPEQLHWIIVRGLLVVAAPAIVVAWRIGRIEPTPRRIWLSGLLGVWLPAVLSVTIASIANQGGSNLHWVPSLFRGFNWALAGLPFPFVEVAWSVAECTLLWPALLFIVSLRALQPQWKRAALWWQLPLVLCVFAASVIMTVHFGPNRWVFASQLHPYWAFSVLIGGALLGVVEILHRRRTNTE